MPDPLMVAVVGPTGSGKTDLALAIADHLDGEIVNCDSMQVFRGFDIGTAKASPAEWRGIPHHLFDIAAPGEVLTAGEYSRLGRAALSEIAGRGHLPVVVGGTGFYLRALIDGLFDGPERDDALRARLSLREERRKGVLHRYLRRLDRAAAGRIHANDRNKLIRAIEVCLSARRPITEMFATGRDRLEGFEILKIGLNPGREILYQRINQRAVRMFECGLLEEVRGLRETGVPDSAKPFESIGYVQALECLKGLCTVPQAVESTQQATRRYAKRQWTWFRRESDVVWLDGFGSDPDLQQLAINAVKNRLKSN